MIGMRLMRTVLRLLAGLSGGKPSTRSCNGVGVVLFEVYMGIGKRSVGSGQSKV
jgi:hypothetical protein